MDASLQRKINDRIVVVDGHWHWTGKKDGPGRAIVRWKGRELGVRRILYESVHGTVEKGLVVRRECADVPCVRPEHAKATRGTWGGKFKGAQDRVAPRLVAAPGGCLLLDGRADALWQPSITWRGTAVRVARAVWEELHGAVPAGQVVAHRCGMAACLAPEHLYLTTAEEVYQGVVARGTFAGENHWNHKLTDSDVATIRSSRCPANQLAARFEVSTSTIKAVRNGHTWTHLL